MLRIGISDCGEKNANYEKFLRRITNAEVEVLSRENGGERELEKLDGLVLTGGEDVSPELYGDWSDETVHINSERDGFEYLLIEEALKKGIPILGICRGLQIGNVYFGGTLIIDLQKYFSRIHKAISEDQDRYHKVKLNEGSQLTNFIEQEDGMVNSAHHQAAERIGRGLKVVARADDGTVEAIEGNGELPSRIVLVQWHPERMQFENPFAHGALDLFNSYLTDYQNLENYAQWRSKNE